eukprot:s3249_g3.t1
MCPKLGDYSKVIRLLRREQDPNARSERDRHFRTAADLAALHGQVEQLRALLQTDVGTSIRDHCEDVVPASGLLELDQYLWSSKKSNALAHACLRGNIEMVQLLLQARACVSDRWSPLYFASHYGRTDLIPLLLHARACLLRRDANNRTPLHLACLSGRQDAMGLLFQELAVRQSASLPAAGPWHFLEANKLLVHSKRPVADIPSDVIACHGKRLHLPIDCSVPPSANALTSPARRDFFLSHLLYAFG